jgi:hypothetical protein
MFSFSPRVLRFSSSALAVVTACWLFAPVSRAASDTLPAKLTDQEFWKISEEASEPNGYFQSDNLVGNERGLQYPVPTLRKMRRGGVYLGVAPDQNFTYILASDPKMAFIVDIRRGNLHAQLMYKALFELSADRAEFLSRLLSKKRPDGLGPASTVNQLSNAYWDVATSEDLYKQNTKDIEDLLTKTHGFPLSADDIKGIEYVYWSFYWYGPSITYSSSSGNGNGRGGGGRGGMPAYADLIVLTDANGKENGYLANEDNFKTMKGFEEKNLLVPVVGDFAGPKALRAVGKYIADHGSFVTAFYTSNVEQYLFQNQVWPAFYTNVATLPLDDASTFIRSARQTNVLDPIKLLLKDVADGKIRSYNDVTARGTW